MLIDPFFEPLTDEEVADVLSGKWQVTPEDTPDRHKDYLPLNLWDETQDE